MMPLPSSLELFVISLSGVLEVLSQILTAGVAITALALLMYATGFNLRDELARNFGFFLACVALLFSSEIIASVSNNPQFIQFWLQMKWAGLVVLPAAYFRISDALLTLTGRPSRGRRKNLVILSDLISAVWVLLVFFGVTVGSLANDAPMPTLQPLAGTYIFGTYYVLVIGLTFYNLARAVLRSSTITTRRRLFYLFIGASAPALSSLIFLFHGSAFFTRNPDFFWLLSITGTIFTGTALVAMAYVVSFFGFSWTDRAIKSRLFRWLMRGPLVALAVLGLTTVIRRWGLMFGDPYNPYVPIVMVAVILVLEYFITLVAPSLERKFFFGDDREDLNMIRNLEERMLSKKDLNQFLEIIAASICDRLQVPACFIAVLAGQEVDYFIHIGDRGILDELPVTDELIVRVQEQKLTDHAFLDWGSYYLLPLSVEAEAGQQYLMGICGFPQSQQEAFDAEQVKAVTLLAERASLALKDRALQTKVLNSLSAIQTEVDFIQRLRASASYDQKGIYQNGAPQVPAEFTDWVKDALTQFWGGPKLTNNPLLELKVVQAAAGQHEGSRTNALRAVLKQAVEQTKPLGERKYTIDWLLYNILDLKFLQGKKVREIAHKLSVSEADLYRKQRIALENVAKNIISLEAEANGGEGTVNTSAKEE